jgi:hypothetical protein
MEQTIPLHCRIPQHVNLRLRQRVGGKHALGAFVSEALMAYLKDPEPQADVIASAILARLKERL